MCVLVAQSCPILCDPMDCSLPGSSVHGILQARILEWVAISFPRGSSWPRDWTWVSCVAGRCFTISATREAQLKDTASIKRHLLLGRIAKKNLDRVLKIRDITLLTKVPVVKAMVFSSSHVWMWELEYKEGWAPKNWCFWTVVLEKKLESPLNCKEI